MKTTAVTTERAGAVVVIRMDDGKANALSRAMIADVAQAIDEAEADSSIRAVALLGRPGRFCGGFDLGVMRSGIIQDIADLVSDGGDLVAKLYGASVPVVAGCTGHAVAAGALLLLGCDVRIGADVECKIGLNEVAIGLVLPEWAFVMADERLDRSALQASVVAAQLHGPAGAVRAGYLDEVVDAADLERCVLERATALAELHPTAYRLTAQRMRGRVVGEVQRLAAADRAGGLVPGVS